MSIKQTTWLLLLIQACIVVIAITVIGSGVWTSIIIGLNIFLAGLNIHTILRLRKIEGE